MNIIKPHVLLFACAVTAVAVAQPTPPPASPEETVTLSPFEVRANTTNGYVAAEGTTGSRYAAPLREIPFPVNIITSDFIENFLAFDFSDAVAYTSSTGVSGGTAAFNLRGIRNNTQYKNGIREGGIYSPIDIERIELIKGANAAIYGQTEPSGLRNIVTKTAKARAESKLWLNVGTDSFRRAAVDVNQPVVTGKLFTRFTASHEYSEQYVQDFARFWRNSVYNSTVWRATPNTTVTTHWEYIKFRNQAQAASNLPFILSSVKTPDGLNTTTAFTGILGDTQSDTDRFRYLNYAGPLGYNQVEYNQIDASVAQRINEVFSLRVLGSHWNRPQDIVRPNATTSGTNATAYNAATGQLLGSISPRLERNRENASAAQADLLAQFATGPVKHKLLVTADYFIDIAGAKQRTSSRPDAPFALSNVFTNGKYFNETFPYAFDLFNAAVWDRAASDQVNRLIIKGLFLSERAAFFHDRVLLMGGVRHDAARFTRLDRLNSTTFNNQVTPANQVVRFEEDTANSPQAAGIFKITPGLSAYASWSRSFNVQAISATNIDINGNPLPVQRGQGREFGLKAALLDERLNFTLGYYDINKTNVPRSARDAAGNLLTIPGLTAGTTRNYSTLADLNSHGAEFDFNWRINDQASVLGGIGWNHARYTRVPNPTEQFLLGLPPDSAPAWNGGLAADYRVAGGRLKGATVRLGWRYQGTQLVSNSTTSLYGNSGIKGAPITINGTKYDTYFFSNHAYSIIDLGIGYAWRRGKWHERVSLDIKNVFDEHYLNIQTPGLPRSANLSYEIKL
jgi:iron complex outermembrane recepter protein